jgi:hypothetical protein
LFNNREEIQRRLIQIIQVFRQKGATIPEKALTLQELGLPPRFEEAMHRRLGQTGIFVEVNGKYYLDEEKLKHFQEQRQVRGSGSGGGGGFGGFRRNMMVLRVARVAMTLLFVALLFANLYIQSWTLRIAAAAVLVVWLSLLIANFYYQSKIRRHFPQMNTIQ